MARSRARDACSRRAGFVPDGAPRRRSRYSAGNRDPARIARRGQADHQRAGGRQPAGAVQVQVGVGKVPRGVRQPLDAAGNQHEPRHRPVEGPERPDRGRAAPGEAQPGLLRDRRFAGGEQHRARAPTATSPRRSAGSTCCARRSRRRSTPTPTSTSSRACDLDEGEIFNAYHEIPSHPGQGRVPDPVHRHPDRSRTSRPARRRPTRSCCRA